jgi:uncharacterized repeat protein (TIGR02543 family)
MKKVCYTLFAAVCLFMMAMTAGAQSFDISCKNLTIDNAGGTRQFYFTCDSGYVWTISSSVNWVSISPSMGTSLSASATTVVTLTVASNSGADRTAEISFSVGPKTAIIPLNQVDETNYWETGDLIPLHLGSDEPEPRLPNTYTIPVVFVGNGWDLADHRKADLANGDKGGLWVEYSQAWSDLFMQQDIIRDMKQYIDVYSLAAISNQNGNVYFTAFKPYIGAHRDGGAMISMATKALKDMGHPNWERVVFVDGSNQGTGGFNVYYTNSEGATGQVANYGNPESEQSGQYWWAHEFLGHDFSNMPDFYYHNDAIDWTSPTTSYSQLSWTVTSDEVDGGGSVTISPAETRTFNLFSRAGEFPTKYTSGSSLSNLPNLAIEWDRGYWWNTDWESDPTKVIWKPFIDLKNEGKGYTQVSVYGGGNWNGIDGFKRPENHNIMNENTGGDCPGGTIFADVGHRMWVWNRLLRKAGIGSPHIISNPDPTHPRSLENFIKFDTINGYREYSNGVHNCIWVKPAVLTRAYWDEHQLFYNTRNWITDCNVNVIGSKAQFVNVSKPNGTLLTKDVDFTVEKLGPEDAPNFVIIRGIGTWSGVYKKKLKTGSEVSYFGNNHTGGSVPVDINLYAAGATVDVLFTPLPTKTGCTFLGWAGSSTASTPDFSESGTTSFTIAAGAKDTILYAVWATTLTFETNGGSAIAPVTVTPGTTISAPATPTKAGNVFLGWYTSNTLETKWNFSKDIIQTATTLYAKWETVVASSGNVISLNDENPPASGTGWTYNAATKVYTITGGDVTVINTTSERRIEVAATAIAHITLENANIYTDATPISLLESGSNGADVTLTLVGKNEMIVASVNSPAAAIEVKSKTKLTIDGDGYLKAYGAGTNGTPYGGGAGIGVANVSGGTVNAAGQITINSGTIIAAGGYNAASIGGGYRGSGGGITINGGVVFANTIGGGSHGSSGAINITGGTVYVGYRLGLQVSGGTAGPINISGNSIVFVAGDDGYLTSPTTTVTEPAKLYKNGEIVFTAEFFDMRDPNRDIVNTVASGTVQVQADEILIPAGTTLEIPNEITLDVNGKILNNEGDILVYLVNDHEVEGGSSKYGYIDNWDELNGNINGITGIETLEETDGITLYPVPVKDVLYVGGANVKSITISNISGQIVARNAEKSQIETARLAKGVYFVTVETANNRVIKKIIK